MAEWEKVADALCSPDYEPSVTLLLELRKCPRCRALVMDGDQAVHEGTCWPPPEPEACPTCSATFRVRRLERISGIWMTGIGCPDEWHPKA